MNRNSQLVVRRPWSLSPGQQQQQQQQQRRRSTRMQSLLSRSSQDSLLPAVIQVQPCSKDAQPPSPLGKHQKGGAGAPTPPPRKDTKRRIGDSGGSASLPVMRSPVRSAVPIILTPDGAGGGGDGDNVSLYSRILSARSNPGTPRHSRRRSPSPLPPSPPSEGEGEGGGGEEGAVDKSKREVLLAASRSLSVHSPPKFNRVFSLGGELSTILNDGACVSRTSPSPAKNNNNNKNTIARSLSR